MIGLRTTHQNPAASFHWALLLSATLLLAGGIHLAVGADHVRSNFGPVALSAGAIQLALGSAVFVVRSKLILGAAVVSSLVFIQLYVLNVTVGLPPLIAHTHLAGTHIAWGMVLSWPNSVDMQGIATISAEAAAVASAWTLSRRLQDPLS